MTHCDPPLLKILATPLLSPMIFGSRILKIVRLIINDQPSLVFAFKSMEMNKSSHEIYFLCVIYVII